MRAFDSPYTPDKSIKWNIDAGLNSELMYARGYNTLCSRFCAKKWTRDRTCGYCTEYL
jgi:hypothetical protein